MKPLSCKAYARVAVVPAIAPKANTKRWTRLSTESCSGARRVRAVKTIYVHTSKPSVSACWKWVCFSAGRKQ